MGVVALKDILALNDREPAPRASLGTTSGPAAAGVPPPDAATDWRLPCTEPARPSGGLAAAAPPPCATEGRLGYAAGGSPGLGGRWRGGTSRAEAPPPFWPGCCCSEYSEPRLGLCACWRCSSVCIQGQAPRMGSSASSRHSPATAPFLAPCAQQGAESTQHQRQGRTGRLSTHLVAGCRSHEALAARGRPPLRVPLLRQLPPLAQAVQRPRRLAAVLFPCAAAAACLQRRRNAPPCQHAPHVRLQGQTSKRADSDLASLHLRKAAAPKP